MITTIRKIVYFGALFLAIMTIVLVMIKDDLGYIPEIIQMTMLSIVFVLGVLLVFLVYKRGLGG